MHRPKVTKLPCPSADVPDYLRFQTDQFSPYFGADLPVKEAGRAFTTLDFSISTRVSNLLADTIHRFRNNLQFPALKLKFSLDDILSEDHTITSKQ